MRKVAYLGALLLAVLTLDQVANGARIAHSLDRNLLHFAKEPGRAANAAMSFLQFSRD